MRELCLKIYGRVQGVGFRRWTQKTAYAIGGVSGWVRNADDGTVEILARAEEEKMEKFIEACQKGSLFSRVDHVDFLPSAPSYFLPPVTDGVFERI